MCGVRDGREEEGGKGSRDFLVDVVKLWFFEVELVSANFVHGVVLDDHDSVCEGVDAA